MLAGIAEMWLRHPLPAVSLLEQAIALNPSLALAHAQLGGSFNLVGDSEQAIVHLRAALRLSSNDQHLFYALSELALAFTMQGKWAAAIEHADLALARRPAYWYAHVLKINAKVRSGRMPAARIALDELMAVKPNFSRAYVEWLPFVDGVWINHLLEGLRMVPNSPIEIDMPATNRSILPAQISSSAYFAAALRFARRPRAAR
jgi:tetratricopeptide (TPR) repeat protein